MYDLRDARDKHFEVGQIVQLNEFDIVEGRPTGDFLLLRITYITDRNTPCALSSTVLEPGFCILGYEYYHETV